MALDNVGRRTSPNESERDSEALYMSREQLLLALDAGGGVGAWDWDVPSDRVYADERFARLFSVPEEEAVAGAPIARFLRYIHPDDYQRVGDAINLTVSHGGDYAAEYRVVQSDDSVRWVYARGHCHLNEARTAIRFPGVVFDITARKQSERQMAEKARFAALGNEVGEALAQQAVLQDALLRCVEAVVKHMDAAFARIWTLSRNEDVLELQASAGLYTHLNGPHSRVPVGSFKIGMIAQERRPHLTNDVLHDPRVSDREWARREGMVAFAGYPLIVEDTLVGVLALFARHELPPAASLSLTSVCTSIAIGIERKRAEAALREREYRYRFLAESMPQMVWTASPDGALNYVNSQTVNYFGMSEEALLGAGWLAGVHPEDHARILPRWQRSLSTGEEYEVEFRLRHGGQRAWRWFLARARPMPLTEQGPESGIAGWVGTCTDIHEQKRGQEALANANRELEEFAYVASHDLQEPLRMVNIYTQMILRRLTNQDPEVTQYAGFVHQGVHRMEALIRDLLSFSRIIHTDQVPDGVADLTEALNEALSILEARISETEAVINARSLPRVRGDTLQIAHVFQNLLSNSLKYRRPIKPEIDISAELVQDRWVVAIKDNGIGFDPQYAERIFGLFKRLHKDEYPGTGLGLAICHRIIDRYGGRMWAEAAPGVGATFYFSLPQAEEESLTAGVVA